MNALTFGVLLLLAIGTSAIRSKATTRSSATPFTEQFTFEKNVKPFINNEAFSGFMDIDFSETLSGDGVLCFPATAHIMPKTSANNDFGDTAVLNTPVDFSLGPAWAWTVLSHSPGYVIGVADESKMPNPELCKDNGQFGIKNVQSVDDAGVTRGETNGFDATACKYQEGKAITFLVFKNSPTTAQLYCGVNIVDQSFFFKDLAYWPTKLVYAGEYTITGDIQRFAGQFSNDGSLDSIQMGYFSYPSIVDSPTMIVDSPTSVVDSPTMIVDSATMIVNSPTMIVNSPTSVVDSQTSIVNPDNVDNIDS